MTNLPLKAQKMKTSSFMKERKPQELFIINTTKVKLVSQKFLFITSTTVLTLSRIIHAINRLSEVTVP